MKRHDGPVSDATVDVYRAIIHGKSDLGGGAGLNKDAAGVASAWVASAWMADKAVRP